MQTFLPYQSFSLSAKVLDRQRLGKQRVEAKQILLALRDPTYGWQNHPAVKMWRGYEIALAQYGVIVCDEWIRRGYKDTLQPWFLEHLQSSHPLMYPSWLTDDFCRSHQSNLVRKNPTWYRVFFPDVADNLPYMWPTQEKAA